MMFDLLDCLILQDIKKIGYKTILKLNTSFESVDAIFGSTQSDIENIIGKGEAVHNILKTKNIDKKKYAMYINSVSEKSIQIFCIFDDDYPYIFKELNNPPIILYVKGKVSHDINKNIAIVGTRNLTHHGNRLTRECAKTLAENGYTIVSGLARGTDTTGHLGALDGGGKTIAILGGGIDSIYPSENDEISKDILSSGGALISESPLGTKYQSFRLKERNRLISCLSKAVIATEVKEKTGTSITVRHSIQLGRKIFIIPTIRQSSINFSNYQKDLVDMGAINVIDPIDVLNNLSNENGYIKTNDFFNYISDDFKLSNNKIEKIEFKGAFDITEKQNKNEDNYIKKLNSNKEENEEKKSNINFKKHEKHKMTKLSMYY